MKRPLLIAAFLLLGFHLSLQASDNLEIADNPAVPAIAPSEAATPSGAEGLPAVEDPDYPITEPESQDELLAEAAQILAQRPAPEAPSEEAVAALNAELDALTQDLLENGAEVIETEPSETTNFSANIVDPSGSRVIELHPPRQTLPLPDYSNMTEGQLLNEIALLFDEVKDVTQRLKDAEDHLKELQGLSPQELADRQFAAQTVENILHPNNPRKVDIIADAKARVQEWKIRLIFLRIRLNAALEAIRENFPPGGKKPMEDGAFLQHDSL